MCIKINIGMNKPVEIGKDLRQLQRKSKLSCLQTQEVAKFSRRHGCGKTDLRGADKEMYSDSGVKLLKLNGCITVIDGEHCQSNCPRCGASRYKEDGKTVNEVVYYFPLRPRLQALLKLRLYLRLLKVPHLSCLLTCTHSTHLRTQHHLNFIVYPPRPPRYLFYSISVGDDHIEATCQTSTIAKPGKSVLVMNG